MFIYTFLFFFTCIKSTKVETKIGTQIYDQKTKKKKEKKVVLDHWYSRIQKPSFTDDFILLPCGDNDVEGKFEQNK